MREGVELGPLLCSPAFSVASVRKRSKEKREKRKEEREGKGKKEKKKIGIFFKSEIFGEKNKR
jgi:hypothetical protein